MNIDSLKSFLSDFNPANYLPDLSGTLGKVELVLRIAVLIGPLLVLGLGLLYLLSPPKEANYSFGFRTHRGMASVEAWQFTQRLAGMVWSVLGLVLTIVMAVLCNGFRGMEILDMLCRAMICVLWELGLVLISWLCVSVMVVIFFDRKGVRRRREDG